ncbi:desulfoferrodoxin [Syntrophorhabdus aromaticivorans]|uniref:Desulfoferrodoxin n=1 Tax=Syntrophorhabdus aromaticivorans TaxID=328301 RepID=A0A971M347_9BACT|nr:desulfoferrodoxin [Syntrophorhabdus aromaticivorans]NLW35158.1 desulfoferrodoxin [Syntrophorhabdus aromaticivorans]OPY76236.1 MAG: Desulfoferrodoxin [Syntrophorhabdus sp. PtaU1.Bin050]
MAERMEVYKCEVCGHIIEVLHAGKGQLVCCNEPMKLITENTVDASLEKHVPVIEKTQNGIKVKVGSIPHPMEEKHWIEWIEVIVDGKLYRQYLAPGQAPEAFFEITGEKILAREYCNLHGLWKA